MPDWILPAIAAPFVGSFLGLLVVRLPAGRPVVFGRSSCQDCGGILGFRDLIPLVSWLATGGRCRLCGTKLSAVYPVVECAAILVALWAASEVSGLLLAVSCGLGWCLLTLGAIDLRDRILPDLLTLPLIPAGLLAAFAFAPGRLADHAVGAAAGFAFLALVRWGYRALRSREGMGGGDAKLLAAAGAWLSWQALPSVVLIAAVAALTAALIGSWAGRRLTAATEIPFGAFLGAAFWLVWLYGPIVPG